MADTKASAGIKLASVAALVALAGCDGVNFDHLGPGLNRNQTVRVETAPRPQPDANGVISYPGYQVIVAKRGDTVTDVANRVGLSPAEMARYNGLGADHELRGGEILALPRRVATREGGFDIESIASDAIDRAEGTEPAAGARTPAGTRTPANSEVEPIRHRVGRGETIYSIARLYDVSVSALVEWNGLGPDLVVREGQYLLIPIVTSRVEPDTNTTPGQGTPTPTPPSASEPLPETVETATVPPSPRLGGQQTASDRSFLMPVDGRIIAQFGNGNEGIDIAAPAGTTVKAAEGGEVALVSRSVGSSSIVLLRHADNIFTVYADIDEVKVAKGQRVQRGQPLGKVGSGNPAKLHFEVRRGADSTDPMPFLQ